MANKYITEAELNNAPSIKIGGREFHIPRLALAQNRVVIDKLSTILPIIGRMEQVAQSENPSTEIEKALRGGFFGIDAEAFANMCDAIYAAVTRGYPEFTREQFENELAIGLDEVIIALPVVMAQSFAFKKKGASQADGAPGESIPVPATTAPAPLQ
jgi:hypothetical protein